MNRATAAIVQVVASQATERQQLAVVKQQNAVLQMNIERMKKDRTEMRYFKETNEGVGFCFESHEAYVKKIRIGVITMLSAQSYIIYKGGKRKGYIIVKYMDSKHYERTTSFSDNELADRKLLKYFYGFDSECKSKQLANDYLAARVNEIMTGPIWTIDEYPGFSSYVDESTNTEKSFFICNTGSYQQELVSLLSSNIINRKLEKYSNDITEVKDNALPFLDSVEKNLLFLFQICGILSTPLQDIG